MEVELEVKLITGEVITIVNVASSCTGAYLKRALQPCLAPSMRISKLVHNGKELIDSHTLECFVFDGKVELCATVCGAPALHLFEPCSALQLSHRLHSWRIDDFCGEFCESERQHCGMDSAPDIGREVAQDLANVAPDLKDIILISSEWNAHGEVILISDPCADTKQACIEALAVLECKRTTPLEAVLEKSDFKRYLDEYLEELIEEERHPEPKHIEQLQAICDVMTNRLTNQFKFSFGCDVMISPVIFGGYASDGSIVGLLSARMELY
eukprot:TRINITY_DN25093_c0_g1_i1.p1 TRINITY_DN25093_c0_g1~~TRINITY_DN25093_c0_g1_i1.p1  ORF type:complete len:269 (+),score=37.33 TRINITY_DN25093_c0_g1_i1:106-912(+)